MRSSRSGLYLPAPIATLNRSTPLAAGLLDLWVGYGGAGPPRNLARPGRIAALGSTTTYGASLHGSVLTMTGQSTDRISLGTTTIGLTDPNTMTIAALVKTPLSFGAARASIYGANDTASCFMLDVGTSGTRDTTVMVLIPGVFVASAADGVTVTDTWYWIVYTRAGTGATHTIYVNGVSSILQDNNTNAYLDSSTQRWIGARAASQYWSGQISYVAIWDRALSPSDAHHLYAPQTRWELFRPARWRVLVQGAEGGGITGTGAITIGAPSLAGSGTFTSAEVTGTGAVTIGPPALAGTGVYIPEAITGDGAIQIGPPILDGTGSAGIVEITGTGGIVIGAPALAGTGTYTPEAITGTGAILIGPPSLRGYEVVPSGGSGGGRFGFKLMKLFGF